MLEDALLCLSWFATVVLTAGETESPWLLSGFSDLMSRSDRMASDFRLPVKGTIGHGQ